MRWRYKFAIGLPVIAALTISAAVIPATVPAFGARTAAATAASTAPRAGRGIPRPPRGTPVFDATFRGRRLDRRMWATCYWWAGPKGCKNFGRSPDAEWYLPSQDRVYGGMLHLVARRRRTVATTSTGGRKVYDCRSGMISSYSSFKFEYGFVQVVASIPHSRGLWPALWLSAWNKRYPPEIDIVESWGRNKTGSFYHPIRRPRARAYYSPRLTRGWQTYSLYWSRSRLRIWIGRRLVVTARGNVPHQRMYFIADLAEYLRPRRGYCTGQLLIRSVKIWKL